MTEEVPVQKIDILVEILDTQTALVSWTLSQEGQLTQLISMEFIFSPLHARYSLDIVLSFPTTTKVLLCISLSQLRHKFIHGNVDLSPL